MTLTKQQLLREIPPEHKGKCSTELESDWHYDWSYTEKHKQYMREVKAKVLETLRTEEEQNDSETTKELRTKIQALNPEQNEQLKELKKIMYQMAVLWAKGYLDIKQLLSDREKAIIFKWKKELQHYMSTAEESSRTMGATTIEDKKERKAYINAINRLSLDVLGKGWQQGKLLAPQMGAEFYPEYQYQQGGPDTKALQALKRIYLDKSLTEKYQFLVESNRSAFGRIQEKGTESIAINLMCEKYNSLRKADYNVSPGDWDESTDEYKDPNQVAAFEEYKAALRYLDTDTTVNTWSSSDEDRTWSFRGITSSDTERTITRGSMNITLSVEAIKELDALITKGLWRGNYKAGSEESNESNRRHDAVSLYFLQQPSEELLKELKKIAKKHYRGDNLLGKYMGPGFAMGEIENINKEHTPQLMKDINKINHQVAKASLEYITRGGRSGHKISEAQFYALQFALQQYNIHIEYTRKEGFKVQQVNNNKQKNDLRPNPLWIEPHAKQLQ